MQRYFERRIKNSANTDDLIQEVFLRLARRADFQSIKHLDGYLFEVAANVLQDRLRHRRSRASDLSVSNFIEPGVCDAQDSQLEEIAELVFTTQSPEESSLRWTDVEI